MKRTREYRRYLAEQKEKRYIRLNKENDELREKAHETILVPLEKPIRMGWYRTFVWKNPTTIKYRHDYPLLEKVLEIANVVQWSMSKKFSYLGRTPPHRRWRYNKEKVDPLKLREIFPHEFGKLPKELQAYFYKVQHLNRWTMTEYTRYAANLSMSLLRIKVYRRYLYSRVEYNREAQKASDRLSKYIYRNNLWAPISEAMGWSRDGRDDWYIDGRTRKLREDQVFAKHEIEEFFRSKEG